MVADILRRHGVVAPEEKLIIAVAHQFLPFGAGIPVGQLTDRLRHALDVDIPASRYAQILFAVRQVDVAEFIHNDIHPYGQPPVFRFSGKVEQADKEQGEKHRGQKPVGVVLIGDDAEVSAFPSSRFLQIDFAVLGDTVRQLVLKDIQPRTQTDHDVAPNVVGGLSENAVRRQGRMARRQRPEPGVQLVDRGGRQQAVNGAQAAFLRREQRIRSRIGHTLDKVNQRHEEIFFRLAPEILPF